MNGNSVREVLEAPFDAELIKTRPGSYGAELSYVEGHEYIKRLNEAFAGAWSFEVVEHRVLESEVLVLGKLTCELGNKTAFGGSSITYAKDSGEIISLADDLKAAATDSLKKAASLFGVGLHLYGGDTATQGTTDTAPPKQRQSRSKPSNGNGDGHGNGDSDDAPRLTSRQLGAILAIGKNTGLDREALNEMAFERFSRRLEFLSKHEASWLIDELKANAA